MPLWGALPDRGDQGRIHGDICTVPPFRATAPPPCLPFRAIVKGGSIVDVSDVLSDQGSHHGLCEYSDVSALEVSREDPRRRLFRASLQGNRATSLSPPLGLQSIEDPLGVQ